MNENQPEIVICKEMELPPTVVERFPDSVRILCEGTSVLILLSHDVPGIGLSKPYQQLRWYFGKSY